MNKILSDDFILVTGSGKVVEKQQLLDDARDREATYEHQEDPERNVRVWRDTAVVTSKLSKEWAEVNLSTTRFGSATHITGCRHGGDMFLGKRHCPCPKRPEIEGQRNYHA
jgi:hypothetical protein